MATVQDGPQSPACGSSRPPTNCHCWALDHWDSNPPKQLTNSTITENENPHSALANPTVQCWRLRNAHCWPWIWMQHTSFECHRHSWGRPWTRITEMVTESPLTLFSHTQGHVLKTTLTQMSRSSLIDYGIERDILDCEMHGTLSPS